MTVSAADFLEGMRRAVNGVAIVSSDGIGGRMGLTVSSFASISADPPIIMVAVNHKGPLSGAIQSNRKFALNLLSAEQIGLAKAFSGRSDNPADNYSFMSSDWMFGDLPVLTQSLVSFKAQTINMSNVGSHDVFLGMAYEIYLGVDIQPLVYGNRQYQKVSPL